MKVRHLACRFAEKFIYPLLPKTARLPFHCWLYQFGGSIEPELRNVGDLFVAARFPLRLSCREVSSKGSSFAPPPIQAYCRRRKAIMWISRRMESGAALLPLRPGFAKRRRNYRTDLYAPRIRDVFTQSARGFSFCRVPPPLLRRPPRRLPWHARS